MAHSVLAPMATRVVLRNCRRVGFTWCPPILVSLGTFLIIMDLRGGEVVIGEWIETAKKLGRPVPAPKGGRLILA